MNEAQLRELSEKHGDHVQSAVHELLNAAACGAGVGLGAFALMAGRPPGNRQAAAIVCVISGQLSDEDLAVFRDWVLAFQQDVVSGGITTGHFEYDTLPPSTPSEGGSA